MSSLRHAKGLLLVTGIIFLVVSGCTIPDPKPYDPPGKTAWKPEGCRSVPSDNAILAERTGFRNLHSDAMGSDEISNAYAPVFEPEWTVETNMYSAPGPVFDSEGNLYFTPSFPLSMSGTPVLISLDPDDGSRRWALYSASGNAAGTPMVLNDPGTAGGEIIYLGLYDRALAVRPDGTVLWDMPTGLPSPDPLAELIISLGLQYHPSADALVGVTNDGYVYAMDRSTGSSLLAAPHSLPGEKSPSALDSPLIGQIGSGFIGELETIVGPMPPEVDMMMLVDGLFGGGVEIANHFSLDPYTGRIWVAATAPDAEDGTVDGVSELGALYNLELVPTGGPNLEIVEVCHRSFTGGSASTPALTQDGSRVYVGDDGGNLIAVDADDCSDVWSVNVGAQIFGSIGVSSDNGELYAATREGIFQVIDQGNQGAIQWRAQLDMYPSSVLTPTNLNCNLAGIGANGLGFQGGAGLAIEGFPMGLSVAQGMGVLDRGTGNIRYFVKGVEETIAVINTGPDGVLYVANSPVGHILARILFGDLVPPVKGGITKYAPKRLDLLIRDIACAAADRAANAHTNLAICPDSADADVTQILALIDQALAAGPQAVADGDLTAVDWTGLETLLTDGQTHLTTSGRDGLDEAEVPLRQGCDTFE